MKDINILKNNGVDVEKSLELFGDMNTYDQMMEDFLSEVDGKLANAKKFKEASDMANYAIVVHSLKSDCRYFGINALGEMFYEHELAGKRNDKIFVNQNFDKLMVEANKMINVVKQYMGVLVNDIEQSEPPIKLNNDPETSLKSILIVDDSNIIRNFITKIFHEKYKVIMANDGEEAISIIDNTPHDNLMCMFLDLNMPGVDGFQVLEYLKNKNLFDTVPVSIITGNSDDETVKKAFEYPIVDMVQKPFSERSIHDIAEKMISRKKNEN